jgi:acetoin utilization protein AcuB
MIIVSDVMTPDPITAMPDDSLRVARDRMAEGNFRRLPVVQASRLVGIITDRDLRRATNSPFVLRERWYDDLVLDQMKVWGAMTANPITVRADAPLTTAAKLMRDHKIGGLPVVTPDPKGGDLLVGIITETDLLQCLIELLEKNLELVARLEER